MMNSTTRRQYTTPGKVSAFSGVGNLSRALNKKKSEVARDLEEIESYTRKREIKRPRVYNPYMVWDPRKLFQIDLIDFARDGALSRKNKGYRYLLCAIDSFTRHLWVQPMKRKTKRISTDAYVALSSQFGTYPQRVLCDSGGEFNTPMFREALADQGTTLIVQNKKAGTVERVQRSLQSLIYKFIAQSGDKRFIHRLDDLVKTYNTRYHRIIKMTPEEAEDPDNLDELRDNLREYYDKATRRKPRFKIGDTVRAKIRRKTFTRGYQSTFTDDVFRIVDVNTILPRAMYTLSDLDDDTPSDETFYAEELQAVRGKAFKKLRLLERDGDRVKLRVQLGKNHKQVGWFSQEEMTQMRQ